MRFVPEPGTFQLGRPAGAARAEVGDGRDEALPVVAGAGRRRGFGESDKGIAGLGHVVEHALRRCGPDAGNKMHQPKPGDTVARVLDKAEHRQHVLDMRGIEKF